MVNNCFTLKEVIMLSKSSELKNLDISNNLSDMVNIINLALVDIHSTLVINQGIIKVPLVKDKLEYNLLDYVKE